MLLWLPFREVRQTSIQGKENMLASRLQTGEAPRILVRKGHTRGKVLEVLEIAMYWAVDSLKVAS